MMDPETDAGNLEAGFSSTKKELLTILKRDGRTSLADLATRLGISKMAILKHIAALEGRGLVERSFGTGGRGRPRAYFSLTRGASRLFPEAYAHMTLCALGFIEEKLGPEAVAQMLRQRAQDLYAANRGRFEGKDFRGKVEELVALRDRQGYMAERGRVGTRHAEVLEHNCPIFAIADRYRDACGVEVDLFRKLLRADVEASHRVVAGDPVCRFLIRKRIEYSGA